jgi:hypothetical protein
MARGSEKKTAGHSTQFKKGQSGNPKGRPRRVGFELASSSYDVIFDRTLAVTSDGVTKELGVEEALQLRTYNQALEGNRRAQRRILKMIAQREKAVARRPRRYRPIEIVKEHDDPDNAFDALLILDLAKLDPKWDGVDRRGEEYSRRLLLEPWAVQLAFSRRRKRRFSNEDLSEVRRLTRDPDTLDWPIGDPDA